MLEVSCYGYATVRSAPLGKAAAFAEIETAGNSQLDGESPHGTAEGQVPAWIPRIGKRSSFGYCMSLSSYAERGEVSLQAGGRRNYFSGGMRRLYVAICHVLPH